MDGRMRTPVVVVALLAVAGMVSSACDDRGALPPPAESTARGAVLPAPTSLPAPIADAAEHDLGPFAGATFIIPAWGDGAASCPSGTVTLGENGQYVGRSRVVNLMSYVAADVDRDGHGDHVAFFMCGEGPESPGWQVVAYRKAAPGLAPIGRVVGSRDGFAMMSGLRAEADGRIAVNVAERYSDSGEQYVPHQWRTFAWQGGRFRQVDGPTSFPTNPPAARLSVDPADLALRSVSGGLVGDLTVTAHNTGDVAVTQVSLMIILPIEVRPADGGWTGCTMTSAEVTLIDCPLGPLPAGSSRVFTATVIATGQPRLVGSTEQGRYAPSNHYLAIEQRPPYAFEARGLFEADIRITTP
jgi:hypothetical protein